MLYGAVILELSVLQVHSVDAVRALNAKAKVFPFTIPSPQAPGGFFRLR